MDMEAGLEHFGRGTAEGCDFVLIVVEPSINSIATAKKIYQYGRDIGIKKIYAIGNKIRNTQDSKFVQKELGKIKLIATVDFDPGFLAWDKRSGSLEAPDKVGLKLKQIKQFLEGELN